MADEPHARPHAVELRARLLGPRQHIHVLAGPRQVGKSTLVAHVTKSLPMAVHAVSADDAAHMHTTWLTQQWEVARLHADDDKRGALLVIDEVQKIPRWSDAVKARWDEDTRAGRKLRVLLLGSSPLLMDQGLSESLAGRFELLRMTQWPFFEMQRAFGWDLEQHLFFGGYPGAASLIRDERRWRSYVRDSLIETTISRDVLQLTRVDKPALLRRLFELGCTYSGQELSLTKLMGQLQDAGNTTTLTHYAALLDAVGLLSPLHKYAGQRVRQRASAPVPG
jgi:uncharacterized protein